METLSNQKISYFLSTVGGHLCGHFLPSFTADLLFDFQWGGPALTHKIQFSSLYTCKHIFKDISQTTSKGEISVN